MTSDAPIPNLSALNLRQKRVSADPRVPFFFDDLDPDMQREVLKAAARRQGCDYPTLCDVDTEFYNLCADNTITGIWYELCREYGWTDGPMLGRNWGEHYYYRCLGYTSPYEVWEYVEDKFGIDMDMLRSRVTGHVIMQPDPLPEGWDWGAYEAWQAANAVPDPVDATAACTFTLSESPRTRARP